MPGVRVHMGQLELRLCPITIYMTSTGPRVSQLQVFSGISVSSSSSCHPSIDRATRNKKGTDSSHLYPIFRFCCREEISSA
ncbi:hypothetical protein MRB53_004376 [Persea americana]|uniref:Uncharacterized protein n=1 Tax=Persea americana TaxID=3435 RepID=A0ACC2MB10_PERAE|nr:hypothetical protein MRB53_004376 [Persea americana]